MSWSGAGVYSLPAAYSPEVNGTLIDADRYNGLTGDVATALNTCLTKDGQNAATNNLPMGGNRHTGVGSATGVGEYLAYGQSNASLTSLTVTGALTASGGVTGTLTGNASTAAALQTARLINGVSFNGTADISITTAGGQLAIGVKSTQANTLAANEWFVLTNVLVSYGQLPDSPTPGDTVGLTPGNGLSTNYFKQAATAEKIMGLSADMILDDPYRTVLLAYVNATLGWRIYSV